MNLPRRVSVFGHKIDITRKPDGDEAEGIMGWFQTGRQLIYVRPDMHPEMETETLYHEMAEAANSIAELHMNHHQITQVGLLLFQSFELKG